MNKKLLLKFIILSLAGIFLFFIPVQGSNIPLTVAVNEIKAFLGDYVIYIPVISVVLLFMCVILGKVFF